MPQPTDDDLRSWLNDYLAGRRSKSRIEREELDDGASHGKRITALWRKRLGIETEQQHQLIGEVARLTALLDENGIEH